MVNSVGTGQKRHLLALLFYLGATLLVVLWLIPFVIAIFTSAKSMDEIMASRYMWAFPMKWVWSNFSEVWSRVGMSHYVLSTFIITVPSVAGALLVSSLAAHALAFYRFKLSRPILVIFVGGMLVPFQMLVIPVYRFFNDIGMINTYFGIILFHIAFQTGFCTFFLRNFMKTVPSSLLEAPRIDGASEFYIYRRVVLPLSLSAMAALGALEFTWIWNDLLWSLVILQSDKLKPVTLGLANMQGEFITNYNMMAAGSLVAAAAPIVLFLFFQRFFIEGLTVGADKG